jgi:arsenite-transporting ATPase
MRIILFTGKGGVGKTTVSAATGFLASESGYNTLIMSTDTAHSLSDSFGLQLGTKPTHIKKNLSGLEIDVNSEIKENWEEVQKQFSAVLNFHGVDAVIADEMAVLPGLDELFSLVKLKEYYDKKIYDVIIIDCAPTGETSKFLSFPEIIRWYMRNVFPIQRNVAKVVRPVVKRVTSLPFPSDDFFEVSQETYEKVGEVKQILSDDSTTSIRIVVNPEKMVVKEAQRSFIYFSLFGFPVDLIIANRIIPPIVKDPYFTKWKNTQAGYIKLIKESFNPVPVLLSTLFSQEINGLSLLEQMAKKIYNAEDPVKIYHKGKPIHINKQNRHYILSIKIPFLNKDDLDILKKDEELVITAGKYKRNILLPRTLVGLEPAGATYENELLKIKFGGEKPSSDD